MQLTIGSRRARSILLVAALTAAGLYWIWGEVTRPRGRQRIAFTPADETCATDGPLRYCVYRDRTGTNGEIVYHLHGRNLDEHVWNDDTYYTAQLQAEWQRRGVRPPTVVTLSYGPTWLLTPKGAGERSGLLEDLVVRLPAIERRIGTPRRRLLLGESMGGLNVLVAGLSLPDRFAGVAALCPGVYRVSPFSSFTEIKAATRRTGADPKTIFGVWMLARRYYADDAEWRRASPLTLIENGGPGSPTLYLSSGLYDAYGNFEGTQALAARAVERGVPTHWHPLYGGHCAVDVASLATFLAP